MYHYEFYQWLFFFYIYCMMGWVIECTYVSVRTRKLTNRGFMMGPWLPIYGSGAIVMLFCANPFSHSYILTFLAGMIGASLLEFVTGLAMEAIFKVRYWDYSNYKFNIMGHVCLLNSLEWGVLTVILTRVVHAPLSRLLLSLPENVVKITTIVLSIIIAMDFALSFKAAIDLRNIIIQMEKARKELEHIQKRIDVLIAFSEEELSNRKDAVSKKTDDIILGLEENFKEIKSRIANEPALINAKDEIEELVAKFAQIKERRFTLPNFIGLFQKNMLKGNPLSSRKFSGGLDTVKSMVMKKK